jgi:hypothetical protein
MTAEVERCGHEDSVGHEEFPPWFALVDDVSHADRVSELCHLECRQLVGAMLGTCDSDSSPAEHRGTQPSWTLGLMSSVSAQTYR